MRKAVARAVLLAMTWPATTWAQQPRPARQPSPFVLCDGQTGHVGWGEALMRIAAITVTAGLSETALTREGADRRATASRRPRRAASPLPRKATPGGASSSPWRGRST